MYTVVVVVILNRLEGTAAPINVAPTAPEKLKNNDKSGTVADVVLSHPSAAVVVVPENCILPQTSQSPAVKDIYVKSFAAVDEKETDETKGITELTNSPTLPAAALLPLVTPIILGVVIVGLVFKTRPLLPVTASASAEATPVPSPVIPAIGNPVALVNVKDRGVPMAKPLGNVELMLGTPPELVTSTLLAAVAKPDTVLPFAAYHDNSLTRPEFTCPEPSPGAHTPSPRQNVDDDAPVPEFKLAIGTWTAAGNAWVKDGTPVLLVANMALLADAIGDITEPAVA